MAPIDDDTNRALERIADQVQACIGAVQRMEYQHAALTGQLESGGKRFGRVEDRLGEVEKTLTDMRVALLERMGSHERETEKRLGEVKQTSSEAVTSLDAKISSRTIQFLVTFIVAGLGFTGTMIVFALNVVRSSNGGS